MVYLAWLLARCGLKGPLFPAGSSPLPKYLLRVHKNTGFLKWKSCVFGEMNQLKEGLNFAPEPDPEACYRPPYFICQGFVIMHFCIRVYLYSFCYYRAIKIYVTIKDNICLPGIKCAVIGSVRIKGYIGQVVSPKDV